MVDTKTEIVNKKYQKKTPNDSSDGLVINERLKKMKSDIIELLYQEELKEFLGFKRSENKLGGRENYRNGSYKKSVMSSNGLIDLIVPRDRNGEFTPKVVKKLQNNIYNIEDKIISLYERGLTIHDISETIRKIYSFDSSNEMISNITNNVFVKIEEWQSRALKFTYEIVLIYKIEGSITPKRTICIGLDGKGTKEVLGLYTGKTRNLQNWRNILDDLKSRGVTDVTTFHTDNQNGLEEAIKNCYPHSYHQKHASKIIIVG